MKSLKQFSKQHDQNEQEQLSISNLRSSTAMYDNLINEEFPNGLPIDKEIRARQSILNYINCKKSEEYLDGELLNAIRDFCELSNINNYQLNKLFTQILIKYENTKNTEVKKELHEYYKQIFLNYCARLYDTILMDAESYTMYDNHIKLQKDGVMYYYPKKGDRENS